MPPDAAVEEHPKESRPAKKFSCQTCKQRKVRCDKLDPCTNCAKSTAECIYTIPAPARRKRTKAPREGLHAKLQRYEEILRSHGIVTPIEESDSSGDEDIPESKVRRTLDDIPSAPNQDSPSPFNESKAEIVHENGSSRLFENSLWSSLQHEYEYSRGGNEVEAMKKAAIKDSFSTPTAQVMDFDPESDFFGLGEHSLVLGSHHEAQSLSTLHPSREVALRLWQIFLDRVDPLVKILHSQTFRANLTNALQDPANIAPSLEALIFSVYTITAASLEEEECPALLGFAKQVVVAKYRKATHQALINAAFIKSSSLMTLQAYMLFLLGMPGIFQSDSLYVLSGIAVRLARRMGLHRDGTFLGFRPFESEMRRRLWWQIVHIDSRASDICGAKRSMDISQSDTKSPLNIYDEDITPEMLTPPPERVGITPNVLSLVRCELGVFFRKVTTEEDVSWDRLADSRLTLKVKEKYIDEIQDQLESRYIRYCDPSIALHFFTSILIRSAICKSRLIAHNPRQFAERRIKVPQTDRDIIWTNAIKLLEYGNLIHTTPNLTKFTWQMGTSYLWDVLLYILIETRDRRLGPEVDRIWQLILSVFENYPRISQENTDTLAVALGRLTVQVWDDCALARNEAGVSDRSEPELITTLRKARAPQRQAYDHNGHAAAQEAVASSSHLPYDEANYGGAGEVTTNSFADIQSYDFSNLLSFDLEPSEWEQWDRLLAGQAI